MHQRVPNVPFGLRFTICPVKSTEFTKSSACAVSMDVKARQAGEISWVGLLLSVMPEANKIELNLGRKK